MRPTYAAIAVLLPLSFEVLCAQGHWLRCAAFARVACAAGFRATLQQQSTACSAMHMLLLSSCRHNLRLAGGVQALGGKASPPCMQALGAACCCSVFTVHGP